MSLRVAGLDVGSSAVKACVFDLEAQPPKVLKQSSVDVPLLRPAKGLAEHDLAALEEAVRRVLAVACQEQVVVGWASAMHGLVLLDAKGSPIGNAISWADERSGRQADLLRRGDPEAQSRTGTPFHPMAWPAKLLWLREEQPQAWRRTARVSDLKSYLWERLTGQRAPLDRSSASSTGLWNSQESCWDEALLASLRLDDIALPDVADGHCVSWNGLELHLGGADGPLGNLGVGAVTPDRIAVSLGTSGAVRRFSPLPRQPDKALFLYALENLGWVQGGAISNGGSVLDWLALQRPLPVEQILEAAQHTARGSEGLLVYPYFAGERAPFWRSNVRSSITGWSHHHEFSHLARATLEGVAYCLQRLLDRLGPSAEPLRCTGGVFESEVWRRLFADVTGRTVALSPVSEATALGAALLTRKDALELSCQLPMGDLTAPDPTAHAEYLDLYRAWSQADQADHLFSQPE